MTGNDFGSLPSFSLACILVVAIGFGAIICLCVMEILKYFGVL